jgi:hypothetical protein
VRSCGSRSPSCPQWLEVAWGWSSDGSFSDAVPRRRPSSDTVGSRKGAGAAIEVIDGAPDHSLHRRCCAHRSE